MLPHKAAISIWMSTSLTFIEDHIQYDIQIMERVLDHVMELQTIPIPQTPTTTFGLPGTTTTDLRVFEYWK